MPCRACSRRRRPRSRAWQRSRSGSHSCGWRVRSRVAGAPHGSSRSSSCSGSRSLTSRRGSTSRRPRRLLVLLVAPPLPAPLRRSRRSRSATSAARTACALVALGGVTAWPPASTRGRTGLRTCSAAATCLVAVRALYLWLRPLSARVGQSVEERRTARRLVDAYGSDSLAFFTLRRDKSYLFSPNRRAFLAYRVVAGTALVSGDPVGDEDEFDELLAELRRFARANGWRVAVLGASGEQLARYRRFGLRAIKLGDEAVLRPDDSRSKAGRSARSGSPSRASTRRLPLPGRRSVRMRSAPARAARRGLGSLAGSAAGARLLDGARRRPRTRHARRARRGRRRPDRRLPPPRPRAGRRRLLAPR